MSWCNSIKRYYYVNSIERKMDGLSEYAAKYVTIQYLIRLPWESQVRYLLPMMGPLAIINGLSVDYVLAMARKGRSVE